MSAEQPPTISGFVAPGFEGVRTAFEQNFERHGEVGATVSVVHRGTCVVDLVGGVSGESSDELYSSDMVQMVFSVTKGATAMCAHLLAERGLLDLDAPVASYWPEFAANGKSEIPVSWLLSHKSGLADVDRRLTFEDGVNWETVTTALAESAPMWEPGTQHGYHAVTFGWLVGEVIRRVSGTTVDAFFQQEFAAPLGLDFHIGLPHDQHSRIAPIIPMGPPPGMDFGSGESGNGVGFVEMLEMLMGKDSLIARALTAPGGAFNASEAWNHPDLWAAELPAANGFANARSIARLYAAAVGPVDGIQTLKPETIARAIEVQTQGPDAVLVFEIPFGLGFMRDSPMSKFGGKAAFGHYGAGGAVGFADPEEQIGFGYAMNQMQLGIAGDPRSSGLIDATYAAIHS
jgi:CubicO group peptidase (beta-lactamase class C family)